MSHLTDDERINLKKLMNEMEYEDNTETIRRLKHSTKIRDNVKKLTALKKEHADMRIASPEQFFNIVHVECKFLYDNYTDIFRRMMQDEIDVTILSKLLIVLKLIEDGQIDQQDGSVRVGRLLKEMYLDSAVKRADALDKEHSGEKEPINEGKSISWNKFKQVGMPEFQN
tara:strand:- start:32 stop:541 length:510 start_codon:yes stop_codon:yes gene_type:complete